MFRDEAVARIRMTMGFRSDLTSEIQQALREAQEHVERGAVLPLWLRSEVSSITTIVGEERIAKPVDFLREWDEDALYVMDDGEFKELRKEELSLLRKNVTGEGKPTSYAFDGTYFRLFPTPDAAYELKMIYHAKDQVLTTNIENKWLAHLPYLLIGIAGQTIAAAARDASAMQQFQRWENEGRRELVNVSAAVETANRRYVMGGTA